MWLRNVPISSWRPRDCHHELVVTDRFYLSLTWVTVLCPTLASASKRPCHPACEQGKWYIIVLDNHCLRQWCITGSMGPDGHCAMYPLLGPNVCYETYGLLAFVQHRACSACACACSTRWYLSFYITTVSTNQLFFLYFILPKPGMVHWWHTSQ